MSTEKKADERISDVIKLQKNGYSCNNTEELQLEDVNEEVSRCYVDACYYIASCV